MTNFEYIKTLNKEELAVFLALQDVRDNDEFDDLTNRYDKWLDQETKFNDEDKNDYKFLYAAACRKLKEGEEYEE